MTAFWGDARFMRECLPPGTPVADPFDIYITIGEDGTMLRLQTFPETKVAQCVREKVSARKFAAPPSKDCVIKIELTFEE